MRIRNYDLTSSLWVRVLHKFCRALYEANAGLSRIFQHHKFDFLILQAQFDEVVTINIEDLGMEVRFMTPNLLASVIVNVSCLLDDVCHCRRKKH